MAVATRPIKQPRQREAKRVRFAWADYRPGVSADVAGPELLRIAAGRPLETLPPREVWAVARAKTSPLHDAFNWDVTKAAEEHWTWQAREMLGSLRVVVKNSQTGELEKVRVFVNLLDGAGYRRTVEVQSNKVLRRRMLELAAREVTSARLRLTELEDLGNVVRELRLIEQEILSTK